MDWSKKLVSKTHVEPQAKDVILAGVVGARSGRGEVRISTMKQFGLLAGTPAAYDATDLAKKINSAPPEELVGLYQQAVLRPNVFREIFNTFQADSVSESRLRQRAADLKVHPDETETCVRMYVASVVFAELATIDGEKVVHGRVSVAEIDPAPEAGSGEAPPKPEKSDALERTPTPAPPNSQPTKLRNGNIEVSIALDSSLDTDKLERQLALLRQYGVL